jgi:hypothetical protein
MKQINQLLNPILRSLFKLGLTSRATKRKLGPPSGGGRRFSFLLGNRDKCPAVYANDENYRRRTND